MTEVVERHPDVLKDPRPTIFFVGFGDSSLDFDIRVFVSDNLKRMPLLHDLHMSLNKALHEAESKSRSRSGICTSARSTPRSSCRARAHRLKRRRDNHPSIPQPYSGLGCQ